MRLKKVCWIALVAGSVASMASELQAGGFLKRLFGKDSAECCEPAPEPVCCEPAPVTVCCEPVPEPVCCCEPAPEPVCCEPAPAPEPCCAATAGTMPVGLAMTAPVIYPHVQIAYARPTNIIAVPVASNSYPLQRTPVVVATPSRSQTVRYITYR